MMTCAMLRQLLTIAYFWRLVRIVLLAFFAALRLLSDLRIDFFRRTVTQALQNR